MNHFTNSPAAGLISPGCGNGLASAKPVAGETA